MYIYLHIYIYIHISIHIYLYSYIYVSIYIEREREIKIERAAHLRLGPDVPDLDKPVACPADEARPVWRERHVVHRDRVPRQRAHLPPISISDHFQHKSWEMSAKAPKHICHPHPSQTPLPTQILGNFRQGTCRNTSLIRTPPPPRFTIGP